MELHSGIWNIPEGNFLEHLFRYSMLKTWNVPFFLKIIFFWNIFVKNSDFILNKKFYLKNCSNKN